MATINKSDNVGIISTGPAIPGTQQFTATPMQPPPKASYLIFYKMADETRIRRINAGSQHNQKFLIGLFQEKIRIFLEILPDSSKIPFKEYINLRQVTKLIGVELIESQGEGGSLQEQEDKIFAELKQSWDIREYILESCEPIEYVFPKDK